MNRQTIVVTLLLVLFAAAPVAAQKVHVDFDQSVDFDSFRTFAFRVHDGETLEDTNPLVHDRVIRALKDQLIEAGLEEVDEDPEIWVTYHASERNEMSLETVNYGYGFGPYWRWDPYWGWAGAGPTTVRTYSYNVGTLVVDVIQADENRLIWRGVAEGTVPDSPKKLEKKITTAVKKMAGRFRRERAKLSR